MATEQTQQQTIEEKAARLKMKNFINHAIDEIEKARPSNIAAKSHRKRISGSSAALRVKRRRSV